jgi:hypothetical protein
MRSRAIISCFLASGILCGCGSSGVSVYNENGTRMGSVSVESDTYATVYGHDGNKAGTVNTSTVYDNSGYRKGIVRASADILDKNEYKKGKVSGSSCYNLNGYKVGHLSSTVNIRATGAACLLLLLQ